MKTSFRSIFGISGKEVSGFLLLSCVLLLILFIPDLANYLNKNEVVDQQKDQAMLDSLLFLLEDKGKRHEVDFMKFSFNPNDISGDSLILLGFNKSSASQIVNYRKKGGQFRYKDDLYKIYSIDSVHLGVIMDLIQLPERPISRYEKSSRNIIREEISSPPVATNPKKEPLPRFNINSADTAMLQTINGIGSVLSKRIVTFRSKLGGFVSLNQLYEVYNLDSTVVSRIIDRTYLEEGFQPTRVEINKLKAEDLKKHPYVSSTQARLIEAYRDQHGPFYTKDDLAKVYLMDTTTIIRLLPYISW